MEPWNPKCVAWNLGSMVPWFHPTNFLIFDIEFLGGTMEPKMCSLEPRFHGSMVPPKKNLVEPWQSDIKSKAFSYLKAGPRLSLGQFLQILNVIKRADFRAKSSVLAEK